MLACTPRRNARFVRRGRASLAWALASYIALQVGFSFAVDGVAPALRDPEFGLKLALLKARVAEAPERPLTLILGSSRAGVGLLPDEFAVGESTDSAPLVFNFAITGAGPVRELLTLRRLLREGFRPRQVLIEIHPLLFHAGPGFGELASLKASQLDWADVRLLSRYVEAPRELQWQWLRTRLAPCLFQRYCWLHSLAPHWLPPENPLLIWDRLLDERGGLALEIPEESQRQFERRVVDSIREYAPAFDRYRVTEAPDRALRELLSLCRDEQISAALFLMPEEGRFEAAYSAEARAEFAAYVSKIRTEFHFPAFDAATWRRELVLSDRDFFDGHHLSARGARSFSRRFGAVVLAGLLSPGEQPPSPTEPQRGREIANSRAPGRAPQVR